MEKAGAEVEQIQTLPAETTTTNRDRKKDHIYVTRTKVTSSKVIVYVVHCMIHPECAFALRIKDMTYFYKRCR